jgi:outer membrane lipoprotein-sorting protein
MGSYFGRHSSKTNMKRSNVRMLKRISLITVIIVSLLSLFLLYNHQASKYRFTVEKWNSYEWNDRQLLINDFLKQYNLYDMTRSDIIQLIGDEPDFYKDYAIKFKNEHNLVYDFGLKKNTVASNITLVINFKTDGKVAKYELMTYSQ